jgi:hypothetical protein
MVTLEVDPDNVKLRSLHVQMDHFDRLRAGGIMEMRVSGLGMYAELLAATAFQAVGKGKLAKEKDKAPELPGLLICRAGERHGWLSALIRFGLSCVNLSGPHLTAVIDLLRGREGRRRKTTQGWNTQGSYRKRGSR